MPDIDNFFCLFTQEFESLNKYVSSLKHSFRNKSMILHLKLKETFVIYIYILFFFLVLCHFSLLYNSILKGDGQLLLKH